MHFEVCEPTCRCIIHVPAHRISAGSSLKRLTTRYMLLQTSSKYVQGTTWSLEGKFESMISAETIFSTSSGTSNKDTPFVALRASNTGTHARMIKGHPEI